MAQQLTSGAMSSGGSHDIASPLSLYAALLVSVFSSACGIRVTYFSPGSLPISSTANSPSLRVGSDWFRCTSLPGWVGLEGEGEDAYFYWPGLSRRLPPRDEGV